MITSILSEFKLYAQQLGCVLIRLLAVLVLLALFVCSLASGALFAFEVLLAPR